MKRNSTHSRRPNRTRSPKLPDELVPIVDAVVEVVFERLRNAATTQNATRSLPPSRKATRLNLPLPKQRTALAEALADLLLADLASVARTRPRVRGTRRARPPTKRGTAPPKTRRARP